MTMGPKPRGYIPSIFRAFQGFDVVDIREWRNERRLELVLERNESRKHVCHRCGGQLGGQAGRYLIRVKHLKMMGWAVDIIFYREKRHCPNCKKIRSEQVDFLCPSSPHVSMDMAWWLNRLSEVTSVLAVSRLESIDKKTCYQVDKFILTRLLQGYKIPPVTHISVDEVYARGPRQLKDGENRDDLFLTIIVDIKTHKVIWVSQSRSRAALDDFFQVLGHKACRDIKVIATDQHEPYAAAAREHCPQATLVWDRFHIVQKFNEALNEDRKIEYENVDPEGRQAKELGDLMSGKYRYVFLTKAANRSKTDQRHIDEVSRINEKISKLEIIKEHFHKMFDSTDKEQAKVFMADVYQWAQDAGAWNVFKWVRGIREDARFWNYFEHRFTTGISEGINRAIKGIKWQAYGYKDMFYFALKILQKVGYLNSRFHFQKL
jgi:transposase